jgi:O-antigen/teichoic acid export membrane protein
MITKFIKDFLKYIPSIIIPGIIGFISIPVLTHFFSPQDYGNYTLILAIIGAVSMLTSWVYLSIVRYNIVYEKEGSSGYFYSNIIKLTVFSAIIIIILYLFFIYLFKNIYTYNFKTLLLVASPILFFSIIFESFKQFFRARNKPEFYSIFESANKVAAFLAGIIFVYFLKTGVVGLLYGAIVSYILIFPWAFIFSKRGTNLRDFNNSKISKRFFLEIAYYGIPLMFSNFATWVLSLSDRFIINYFFTTREVGIYSASYKIAEYTVSVIIMLVVFAGTPLLINTWEKEGVEKCRELNMKITRFFLITTFPLSVFLSIFAKNIVMMLTSKDYLEGYKIIPIIIAGVFLLGLQQRFYAGFFFYKKTNLITYSLVLAAVLNVVLNIFFVPRFGYLAAAVTTLIAYSASFVLVVVSSLKLFKWEFPFKTFIKAAFSSAAMGFAIYFINKYVKTTPVISLIYGVLISLVIYFVLLFLTKELKLRNFYFPSIFKKTKKE